MRHRPETLRFYKEKWVAETKGQRRAATGTSLFFGWLTIGAGSFWPAALAHPAVNSVQQGVIDDLELSRPALQVDVIRTALIRIVGLASWCALRRTRT